MAAEGKDDPFAEYAVLADQLRNQAAQSDGKGGQEEEKKEEPEAKGQN